MTSSTVIQVDDSTSACGLSALTKQASFKIWCDRYVAHVDGVSFRPNSAVGDRTFKNL